MFEKFSSPNANNNHYKTFNPISFVSEGCQILTNDHGNVCIWNRLSVSICLLLLVSVSVLFSPSMHLDDIKLGLGS